ncbi:MAG TPA: hypothetical protein VGU66_07585 [Candidatus Elarobacter sp.]|nr:hypothetical protein [Candidatus Elarobacter sp.]
MIHRLRVWPLVVTAGLLLASCSGGTHSALPAANGTRLPDTSSRANVNARIEAAIDKDIHGQQRKAVKEAMLRLPQKVQDRIGPGMVFGAVTTTSAGNATLANSTAALNALTIAVPVRPGMSEYRSPRGTIRFPQARYVAPKGTSSGRQSRYISYGSTGTGPYRQVVSNYGYDGEGANVDLPCSGVTIADPNNDTGYVYLNGWADNGSAGANEIEADLQYGSANNDYAPLMRFSDIAFYYGYTTAGGNGPNNQRWSCAQTDESALALQFVVGDGTDSTGHYETFTFYTYPYAEGFGAHSIVLSRTIYDYGANNWNGWSATCGNCVMSRSTSIGQITEDYSSGSYFGPVAWRSAYVLTPTSSLTWDITINQHCINRPYWSSSDPNDECYSGPTPPAAKTITVNFIDYGDEDVTVDTT